MAHLTPFRKSPMICRSVLPLLLALICCGCEKKISPTPSGATTAAPPPAREEDMAEEVQALVTRIATAIVAGEYDTVIDLTHPKALEAEGGRENALRKAKLGVKILKKQGVTFRVGEIGQPTVVKGDTAHFVVVPYTLLLSAPGKKGLSKTSLVGTSTDQGKTWKFIQVKGQDDENQVRRLLPDLPPELKIPRTERVMEDIK